MPRLKANEIGLPDEYKSPFPPAEMSNGVAGSAWRDIAEATAPARAWRATHRLSFLAIGRLATMHGVPKPQVKAVKTISDLGQLPLGNDFVKLAKVGSSLVGDLLDYSKAIDAVASAVPVLGTYARLIVGFVTFLKNAFSRAAQAKLNVPKNAKDALAYDQPTDEAVANYCADWLAAKDWTRIFLPARKPGDSFKLVRTSFIGDGTPDGYSIVPAGGVKQQEYGLGFVPGVAGRFVQWQYPIKVFGSNRPASPWESLISIADLEPSVTQLTVLAWQMVLKNSPNMFRIAPYTIKVAWRDFFGTMGDWARWLKKTDQTQGAAMADAIATWVGKEYPGAPSYRVRNPWTKYKKKALESGEVQTADADALVDFIVDRQHGDSLDAALATITCAYVGPQFALIKENDTVRELWEARRKQLLGHRARWSVELDLVPDDEYRAALSESRKGGKPADLQPVPKGYGGVLRFADPKKKPPPASALEPSMPNNAGGGSGTAPGKGKDGGGAAVAVAAAAAAFFMLR